MPDRILDDVVAVNVQSLYDTATIPAPGIATLSFFQTPRGGAGGNFAAAAAAKTYADTNMEVAGMLPAGFNFKVLGIRLQPGFGMTRADSVGWSSGAWFTFWLGSIAQLRVPVDTVPAGAGPHGFYQLAAAATNAAMSHGMPDIHNAYNIGRKPIDLLQGVNFYCTVDWTAVIAVTGVAPVQPAPGLPLRCYLDGFYYRARG